MKLVWLVLAAAIAAGLFAAPVSAKEDVVAQILAPISRDAEPGSRVTIAWTLTYLDAGKRHPFGAGAVFVRLIGSDDSRSVRVPAESVRPGRYRATVRVPRGGIRRVQIGLLGTVCDGEGCRPAPMFFPLVGRVFR